MCPGEMGHGDMGNGEMGNGHVDPHRSMASNFVDDIEDYSEDGMLISVFNLNHDDPGYFEIG